MTAEKQVRMNHLLRGDGRTVIAAMDHGIAGIAPLAQLARPEELISAVVGAGADALIVTPGIARTFSGMFGRAGLIVRADCGPTALTGQWCDMAPALAVEDAIRLGADAVAAMGIVGADGESASLKALASLAGYCDRWGIVLLAEMLPGGFAATEVSQDHISVAARVGADLGADLIKIRYSGSSDSFRSVTGRCYRPVVVLGGSKQSPAQLLASTREALEAGAIGVAVGRNIWQAPDPSAITASLAETVHG